jgi:4-alpha-glucanotransferase
VVYTGTHDNDTTRGWFTNLTAPQQQRVLAYLHCPEAELVWAMLRLSQSSVARYAVMPFQDLLELDSSARMNVPGVAAGNWEWRLPAGSCKASLAERLYSMSAMFNRIGR